jgi:hypothetical protein
MNSQPSSPLMINSVSKPEQQGNSLSDERLADY